MKDEEIKKYVENGGRLFTVRGIDVLRDGGNLTILTTIGVFYMRRSDRAKSDNTLHTDYPPYEKNIIEDELTIKYFAHRIERYIERCEYDIVRDKNIIREFKESHDIH